MGHLSSQRKNSRVLAAAVAVAGFAGLGTSEADAALIMDVRATGVSGGAVLVNSKSVIASAPGDTITLAIFARVSGTNGANDETVQSAGGGLRSVGGVKGNINSGAGVVAPFNGASHTNGSIGDYDSDGDLDLGTAGSTSTGKLFGRANAPVAPGGIVDAQTSEIQLAQAVWTYTGGDPTFADINWVNRTNSTGGPLNSAALWFEDSNSIPTGNNPTNSFFGPGSPVHVEVPEPASLGLLSLAAVGLLGRRRK